MSLSTAVASRTQRSLFQLNALVLMIATCLSEFLLTVWIDGAFGDVDLELQPRTTSDTTTTATSEVFMGAPTLTS
jgi:hypothetical protein